MSRRTAPTSTAAAAPEPIGAAGKLERAIGWGLVIIVGLMPVHAFLSVWLGSIFGHQAVIQAWKEVALVCLSGATGILLITSKTHRYRLKSPWIYAAATYAAISLLVTLIAMPELKLIAFGAKTNLEFIVAGIIAWTVATPILMRRLITTVLIGAGVVVGFGVLQIFVLPPNFLTHFGYGPDTILPYQRIAEGTSTLRFPSTLGGPNQLGSYLLLPLALTIALAWHKRTRWLLLLTGGAVVCLIGAHSRSAWAAALFVVSIGAILGAPRRMKRRVLYGVAGVAAAAVLAVPAIIASDSDLQYYVLHSSIENQDRGDLSNGQHIESLEDGTTAAVQAPFGHGLGTAGPATFQTNSPNIIENYYLQIAYETGFAGLAAFLILVALLCRALWRRRAEPLGQASVLAILGVSLICLLLPAWTDSTTALITWICVGAAAANWAYPKSEASRV